MSAIGRRNRSARNAPTSQRSAGPVTRQIAACLLISLLLAGLATPLIKTLAAQTRLMTPPTLSNADRQRVAENLRDRARIAEAQRRLFGQLVTRPDRTPDWRSFREMDPGNSLYDYLELLPALREASRRPTTQPADLGHRLTGLVRKLDYLGPPRINFSDYSDAVRDALGDHDPRAAAVLADLTGRDRQDLRNLSALVVDELAEGLCERADALDPNDHARQIGVRLLTDLVQTSPSPEIVTVAAARLPAPLLELGAADAAGRVVAFRALNRCHTQGSHLNLLPWTAGAVLAAEEHDAVMRSWLMSIASLAVWIVLVISCHVLFILSLFGGSSGPPAGTQFKSPARLWLGGLVVIVPLLVLYALISLSDGVEHTWLLSKPSLHVVWFWIVAIPLAIGVATRLFTSEPEPEPTERPRRTSLVFVLLAVAAMLTLGTLPIVGQPGAPPVSIRCLRHVGLVGGILGGIILLLWVFLTLKRHAGNPAARRAHIRSALAIASAALLLATAVSWPALLLNRHRDGRHRDAFVEAFQHPIADHLGANWYETAFKPARDATMKP